MDTTKAIRDLNEHVKQEYTGMVEELLKPENNDRDEQVKIFAKRQFSSETEKHFMDQVKEREKIHFDFMAEVFPATFQLHYGHPLPPDYPPHDHSKDELFAFILAIQFDILKEPSNEYEKTLQERSASLVKQELDRHYTKEPHHPEHEDRTGKECTEYNIFEMAIDRLARNVQFNHGEINLDQMNKFLPKFYLGDTKEKVETYKRFMNGYQEKVSAMSKELYYDRKC